MDELVGTPYSLSAEGAQEVRSQLRKIDERVALLRGTGVLTEATLRDYYGLTRFAQIAESNALEGSTLSIGETELAVAKGLTLTGHDPAFSKDAQTLSSALERVAILAKDKEKAIDLDEILEVHSLILAGRPEAGRLRSVPVRISGADHRPPKTLQEVSERMQELQSWSRANRHLPAVLRAAVLHAWLTHIHPFADGNGRTARAITTLELVRAGYAPIIIKKPEKSRYLAALAESDSGGDIADLIELFVEKADSALLGLENAAKRVQGYDPLAEKVRIKQAGLTKIWTTSVQLLVDTIEHLLTGQAGAIGGRFQIKRLYDALDVESFVSISARRPMGAGWAFILSIEFPGLKRAEALAFFGHRSAQMFHHLGDEPGVSLFWSRPNPDGYPKWKRWENASFGVEMTTRLEGGAKWFVRSADQQILEMDTKLLAEAIIGGLFD